MLASFRALAAPLLAVLAAGCTIQQPVSPSYPDYLANNEGAVSFESTGVAATYELTPETAGHRVEFRSAMAGAANLWIVEFGTILEATLQSQDVRAAFTSLRRADGGSGDVHLVFDLDSYVFEDSAAHISLSVTATRGGSVVFDESYQASGKSQGGKMFWGGAFAMRNAIHQSTKLAMDEILAAMVTDLKAATPTP